MQKSFIGYDILRRGESLLHVSGKDKPQTTKIDKVINSLHDDLTLINLISE